LFPAPPTIINCISIIGGKDSNTLHHCTTPPLFITIYQTTIATTVIGDAAAIITAAAENVRECRRVGEHCKGRREKMRIGMLYKTHSERHLYIEKFIPEISFRKNLFQNTFHAFEKFYYENCL